MKRFIDELFNKRHHLVLEEEDVTRVLRVIVNPRNKFIPNMRVGNCGWANDKQKWFIHFDATNSEWNRIKRELKVVRVFTHCDIPKNTIGVVYTTD